MSILRLPVCIHAYIVATTERAARSRLRVITAGLLSCHSAPTSRDSFLSPEVSPAIRIALALGVVLAHRITP